MTIDFLTKLFPFLTFLILLGCPSVVGRAYEKAASNDAVEAVSSEDEIIEQTENNVADDREDRMKKIITRLDSVHASLEWKLIKDNLYLNNKGEVGFQIDYATEVGSTKNYISHFCDTDTPLSKVIDTKSFKYLGSTFYKDKNNIYHYFDMAYGGRFSIYTMADYATFRIIGDYYAKDKNNIYGERAFVMENVDYRTFTSDKGAGPYAKDKNGYYFWDELIMTHKEFYKEYKRKSVSVKEFSKLIRK